jgi:hypothetical protein
MGAGAVVALGLGALALLLTARPPDGFSEVEFGPPDTWGAMAGGIAFGLGLLAVAGALVAGVVALLGRWPLRRLLLIPAAVTGVGAAIVAVTLLPRLDEGRERAECATFEVERADWTSRDPEVRLRSADVIAHCEPLAGMARADVERLLGPPPAHDTAPADLRGDLVLRYPVRDVRDPTNPRELQVVLAGDDVISANLT